MDVVYVLMHEGWEYNDEVFFRAESGGGTPHSFFTKEEEAQSECDKRNLKDFKSLWETGEIREYCYGIDELIHYNKREDKEKLRALDKICEKIFDKDFNEIGESFNDGEDLKILSESDEDWKELMSHLTLNFWDVVAVERG
jgi:hypothetical protein